MQQVLTTHEFVSIQFQQMDKVSRLLCKNQAQKRFLYSTNNDELKLLPTKYGSTYFTGDAEYFVISWHACRES